MRVLRFWGLGGVSGPGIAACIDVAIDTDIVNDVDIDIDIDVVFLNCIV